MTITTEHCHRQQGHSNSGPQSPGEDCVRGSSMIGILFSLSIWKAVSQFPPFDFSLQLSLQSPCLHSELGDDGTYVFDDVENIPSRFNLE